MSMIDIFCNLFLVQVLSFDIIVIRINDKLANENSKVGQK